MRQELYIRCEVEDKNTMRCSRKKRKFVIGAVIVAVLAAIGVTSVYQSRAEPEKSRPVLITEYVSIPAYTGRTFSAVQARSVDDDYMDSLMSRMLATYNKVRGTDYEAWTDEQVAYTTQGQYTSEKEWRAYLKEKYRKVEQQQAKEDTALFILSEIVSESRLTGYAEEDLEAAKESAASRLIFENGFSSRKGLLDELELTEKEYADLVEVSAKEALKYDYVISAIAEKEELEVAEEDNVYDMSEKVIDFLYAHNILMDEEKPPQDFG